MTDPFTLLGWFLAIPIIGLFAAAAGIGLWLRFLAWLHLRHVLRLQTAVDGIREAVDDDELAAAIERAFSALKDSERARNRYAASCHRFGVRPWT